VQTVADQTQALHELQGRGIENCGAGSPRGPSPITHAAPKLVILRVKNHQLRFVSHLELVRAPHVVITTVDAKRRELRIDGNRRIVVRGTEGFEQRRVDSVGVAVE
jgi:hypothetical protein